MTLCECGCGLPAPIATKTNRARGCVKGQPRRFRHGHTWRGKRRPDHAATMRGKNNPNYRHGRHCA